MSSFIVADSSINSIASFLYRDLDADHIKRKLATLNIALQDELGEEMYRLNLAAVDVRYGDYSAGAMGACSKVDYTFAPVCAGKVPVIKALACWLYQCSEGQVPETELYKIMRQYQGELAMSIIRESPEWAAAEWA